MQQVDKDTFIKSICAGDVGVIYSDNLFAKAQNWFRKKFDEGPIKASHAFMVKTPPQISEANGIIISGDATFLKNIGDSTKCWFFRYTLLTPEGYDDMLDYMEGAEDTGGHYSVGGILQFAKSFITGKQNEKDESGVFCSEYDSRTILKGVPAEHFITSRKPWQITPTYLVNWGLGDDARIKHWMLGAYYNGQGGFYVQ